MPKVIYKEVFRLTAFLSALLLAGGVTPRIQAATIFAINSSNALLRFNSATPGTLDQTTAVTGISTSENLLGIDFRPATGELYGLTNASRLYTINTLSGVASPIGSAGGFALVGSSFGFDFNPTVDRIRITSNTGQNLRVNPITGVLATADTPLSYAAGDANAGATPNVTASAYTNSFPGATTTTLYDIDVTLGILATQNPPNNGILNTVGSLGIAASSANGFDIEPGSGIGYAGFRAATGAGSNLYRINLGTGAATSLGGIGSGQFISGLAVVSDVPEPATFGLIGLGLAAVYLRRKR